MISQIISVLDAAVSEKLPAHKRHGLCEQVPTEKGLRPMSYQGGGQGVPVIDDSHGTVSYWRITQPIRQQSDETISSCNNGQKRTYTLRYVLFGDRTEEVCGRIFDALSGASSDAMGTLDNVETAIGALMVKIVPTAQEGDSVKAAAQELPKANLPLHRFMAYVDFQVEVIGEPHCFDDCGAPVTITLGTFCEQIQNSTWDKVAACLTDAQEDAAIAALCEGAQCGPMTLIISLEGVAEPSILVDTCEDNTVNISIG